MVIDVSLFGKLEVKNQIIETMKCIFYNENDTQQVSIHLRMSNDN